jgi:hypothetical protein
MVAHAEVSLAQKPKTGIVIIEIPGREAYFYSQVQAIPALLGFGG